MRNYTLALPLQTEDLATRRRMYGDDAAQIS
jgi:hypothetical protein